MLCPDGYVTIHACQTVFRDIARERWEKERPEFRKIMKTTRYDLQRESEAYDEGVTCDYVEEWEKPEITKENWEIASYFPAFRRWATTFLVVRHVEKIWACSPQGQIIRPSDDLFHTVGDFRISFSLNSEGFAELEKNQARFSFLEETYFTIKSAESLPSFVPESKRRRLQPFAGWSICWKPKSFDNWRQELREVIIDAADRYVLEEKVNEQPKRGAPKKGGGQLERAVQQEFVQRKNDGLLEGRKLLAIYAEADEWARKHHGQGVSSSTADRYLKPILKPVPSQK
jgi:hypothetical protein